MTVAWADDGSMVAACCECCRRRGAAADCGGWAGLLSHSLPLALPLLLVGCWLSTEAPAAAFWCCGTSLQAVLLPVAPATAATCSGTQSARGARRHVLFRHCKPSAHNGSSTEQGQAQALAQQGSTARPHLHVALALDVVLCRPGLRQQRRAARRVGLPARREAHHQWDACSAGGGVGVGRHAAGRGGGRWGRGGRGGECACACVLGRATRANCPSAAQRSAHRIGGLTEVASRCVPAQS